MSDLQKLFDDAEIPEYTPFIKGNYAAKVTDAALDLVSVPNKVKFEFTIASGEYLNRKVWKHYQLSPERVAWLKKDLTALAIDITDLKDEMVLGERLSSLMGSHVEIAIDPKPNPNDPAKPYNNCYINKPLPPDFDGGEDIPF